MDNIIEVKTIRYDDIETVNENFIIGEKIVNKLLSKGWILLDVHNGYYFLGLPRKTNINPDFSSKNVSR